MSSFTRRVGAATIAFGVLAGVCGVASPATADEPPEMIGTSATAPAEPAEPSQPAEPSDPADPSPEPEQPDETGGPATPTAATGAEEVAGLQELPVDLSGFAPGASLSASLNGPDGAETEVTASFEPVLAADADGAYSGRLRLPGEQAPGDYRLDVRQPDGATASLTVTVIAPDAPGPQPAAQPSAAATKPTFLPNEEITYLAQHFMPGGAINATVTFPDGSSMTAEGDGSGADQNGSYAGKLSYTGALPVGDYSVRVFQDSGPEASFAFRVAGSAAAPSATAAPSPSAAAQRPDALAATGPADPAGPILAGLLLASGGGALLAARRACARP